MKDALNLLILCFLKAEVMKGVKSTEQYFIVLNSTKTLDPNSTQYPVQYFIYYVRKYSTVLYSTVLYCNPMLNV
jgi:hypothetical protein